MNNLNVKPGASWSLMPQVAYRYDYAMSLRCPGACRVGTKYHSQLYYQAHDSSFATIRADPFSECVSQEGSSAVLSVSSSSQPALALLRSRVNLVII